MKKSLTKKNFGRASIVHGIVILLTLLLPLFRGCSPKKHEVITFIDLSGAPAPASAPEPEEAPDSVIESKPEPKPKPKPEPKPEKKPAPEPVKTNLPPKKVETNAPPKKAAVKKPAVTNAPPKKAETNAPAKPKTLEKRLEEVRQGGKPVAAKPNVKPGPQLDYSGLKSALNSAAAGSGSSSGSSSGTGSGSGGGAYSPFAGYYDSVKRQMYAVWQQPAGAPVGLIATATVQIGIDGTVYSKSLTRRSGNLPFDQSVQNALNVTTRLPVPPADLPSRTIDIEFVLAD